MRKLYLVVASCAALAAFMGFSSNAFAAEVHDPGCNPYGNQVGMYEFSVDTPGTHMGREVSNIIGSARACGSSLQTDIFGITCVSGYGTLYNHADVTVPGSARIADNSTVAVDSYAGSASVNVMADLGIAGCLQSSGIDSVVTVKPISDCEWQRTNRIVGATPQGPIVSCLRGDSALGYNYSWSTLTNGDKALTIGPMRNDTFNVNPGLTYVDLDLCDYYGNPGGGVCGSAVEGDQWQQKNGCLTGTYTATATMNNGTVTPVVQDTIQWTRAARPYLGREQC